MKVKKSRFRSQRVKGLYLPDCYVSINDKNIITSIVPTNESSLLVHDQEFGTGLENRLAQREIKVCVQHANDTRWKSKNRVPGRRVTENLMVALLSLCNYATKRQIVDQMIMLYGIPEEVTSSCLKAAVEHNINLYITEDANGIYRITDKGATHLKKIQAVRRQKLLQEAAHA